MKDHKTHIEALRAAASFIFGEDLEVDFDGTIEEAESHYRDLLKLQLSLDGTAFKFSSKDTTHTATYECTIGAPDDYLTMVKPTAEPLPDYVFDNSIDYITKRELRAYIEANPYVRGYVVLKHFKA